MSINAIVDRIIADAEERAQAIDSEAEENAAKTVAEARKRAERDRQGVEAEVGERVKAILDGKAATARLDCAKILLSEKRRVIDTVYAGALNGLLNLEKPKAIKLAESLLYEYAEKGDEIMFADNYKYVKEVSALSVIKEKELKISAKTVSLTGGFVLSGKNSDKDISYGALLTADRELYQAEIAAKIFGAKSDTE